MEIKQHFALSGNSGRPVGFFARPGAWPCREVTLLCLGGRRGGPARSLSPAERGASARLSPWCFRGCVTARSVLPYCHTAVASYCSPGQRVYRRGLVPLPSRSPGRPRPLGYVPESAGRAWREQKGWGTGAACPQHSLDGQAGAAPLAGTGREGPADTFTGCAEGKPAGPAFRGQPGPSVLPGFTFGNKFVYMFYLLGSCPCRTVQPVLLPRWARRLFVLVPNGEQVPKRKRAAKRGAVPAEPGLSPQRRAGPEAGVSLCLGP